MEKSASTLHVKMDTLIHPDNKLSREVSLVITKSGEKPDRTSFPPKSNLINLPLIEAIDQKGKEG